MKKGGVGGHLTKTGLTFEEIVDLNKALDDLEEFEIKDNVIYKNEEPVAELHSKHEFYRYLESEGVDYEEIISRKILPDIAVLVYETKTFFVFEVKYQEVEGSTDEKLQTCHFKVGQYRKLAEDTLGYKVKYVYVLNDWFKQDKYEDVLEYIKSVEDCDYLFNEVPREYLQI